MPDGVARVCAGCLVRVEGAAFALDAFDTGLEGTWAGVVVGPSGRAASRLFLEAVVMRARGVPVPA